MKNTSTNDSEDDHGDGKEDDSEDCNLDGEDYHDASGDEKTLQKINNDYAVIYGEDKSEGKDTRHRW